MITNLCKQGCMMPEPPVGRGGYCVRQYYDRIISPAIMRPHDQFSQTFITTLNVTVPGISIQYNYCRKSIHRFHNRLYNHGEGLLLVESAY